MILQGLAAANAQTTETQLRVLREAKSDSHEIAQEAAQEAALRVGQQVQEIARQATTAGSPNPMASMVTQAIQPFFTQTVGRMFGMLTGFEQPDNVSSIIDERFMNKINNSVVYISFCGLCESPQYLVDKKIRELCDNDKGKN